MKRVTIAALAAVALAAGVVPAALAAPAAKPDKVLVVGIDGLLFDKIEPADAPNLDALIARSRWSKTTLYANPMAPTLSGPGWSTNLTGVWPDKHKVTSNNWGKNTDLSKYPDFLTRLENAKPELSTYAIADWSPLTSDSAGQAIISSKVDDRVTVSDQDGYEKGDAEIADKAAAKFGAEKAPDASFVYFGDVDEAGHSCGAAGACYKTAIEKTDQNLGKVLKAIEKRTGENWQILVTSDHGHTDKGGHGGNSQPERTSFIIDSTGGRFPEQPKNVDIAATVLSRFGVSAELDGQVLGTNSNDPFHLVQLKNRKDETGIPETVLGWSHTPPPNWKIDNAGMGTGGVEEWRGWSFTTDQFWTRTDPGQQRESNVRARGIFAVADSDEWADKAFQGEFNSKLVSQPYSVTGRDKVNLSFGSHYRKDGGETATVTVSFDGGASTTVLTYPGDAIAKIEQLSVPVPAGAKQMTVSWNLNKGNNNWYWAVDNPHVW
ncbi:nucleotide pyrophosphatase [Pseudonocardiaceae bacterium YIM PH 21723]|nr:nucleotide pyrophosphatase [Pseudonocardiaceae bacterium YIM PH 21723]